MVLERGQGRGAVATVRWDSLRLITPNWMTGCPASYSRTDPDGYMSVPELVIYLQGYAGSSRRRCATARPWSGSRRGGRFSRGHRPRTWVACNVVVATGTENRAYVPPVAGGISRGSPAYRQPFQGPHRIPDGGVLMVGSSATVSKSPTRSPNGAAGHPGGRPSHPDTPQLPGPRHRWWLHRAGSPATTDRSGARLTVARKAPSLQLSGRSGHRVSLEALAAGGVTLAGRLVAADGQAAEFVR